MIAYGTLYGVPGDEDDRAEIEGVADAPRLIIDERVLNRFSRTLLAEVTVEQPRTGILCQVHEALERLLSELDATAGQHEQEVALRPGLQQALHGGARKERGHMDRLGSMDSRDVGGVSQQQHPVDERMCQPGLHYLRPWLFPCTRECDR